MNKVLPRFLVAGLLFLCSGTGFSQILLEEIYSPDEGTGERVADHFTFDLTYNSFVDMPRGVKGEFPSLGYNIYYHKDIRFGESNFSLALGFGWSHSNIHSNGQFNVLTDSITNDEFVEFAPRVLENDYKTNKLTLNYLEVPLQFRFKTPGRFRLSVGVKGGLLINPHTKYKDATGKYKDFNIPNFLPYRYGAMVHLGYRKFTFNGFYSLTPVFEEGDGTPLTLWSAGLSFFL